MIVAKCILIVKNTANNWQQTQVHHSTVGNFAEIMEVVWYIESKAVCKWS